MQEVGGRREGQTGSRRALGTSSLQRRVVALRGEGVQAGYQLMVIRVTPLRQLDANPAPIPLVP